MWTASQVSCGLEVVPLNRWGQRLIRGTPLVVCLAVAVCLWVFFFPGLFSFDSMQQYQQAVRREYTDAHPAIMAISLAGIMDLGGDIQHLMFVQCLAGVLGVFCLARSLIRFLFPDAVSEGAARWWALLVLLALLCPLSPLPFYLMTFWKDVWVMIALCWLGAVSLELLGAAPGRLTAGYAAGLVAFLALAVLSMLVRHNAIVLLPVFALLFAVFLARVVPLRVAVPAALVPVLLYAGTSRAIDRGFQVKPMELGLTVAVVELVGVCAADPEIEQSLPYMSSFLKEDYREHYVAGFCDKIGPGCLKPGIYGDHDSIYREYRQAAWNHPLALADVKLGAFLFHLGTNPCLKFHAATDNPPEKMPGPRFAEQRQWLTRHVYQVFLHPKLRWVFMDHGIWLVACLASVGLCLGVWGLGGGRRYGVLALLLLAPLGYYLSYLLASVAGDFRYMYPSSLWMQTAVLAGLAGLGHTVARKWGQQALELLLPTADPEPVRMHLSNRP